MVAADARTAITFALSPGQASDAKAGRALLGGLGPLPAPLHLIMDRAYEDGETRLMAVVQIESLYPNPINLLLPIQSRTGAAKQPSNRSASPLLLWTGPCTPDHAQRRHQRYREVNTNDASDLASHQHGKDCR